MSVRRSPPPTPAACTSEPVPELELNKDSFVNKPRSKRLRFHENSPDQNVNITMPDLQEVLEDWKRDQDASIAKLLSEQSGMLTMALNELSDIKTQNAIIQKSNTEIKKSNLEIERSIAFMSQQFDDLKREVDSLKRERLQHKTYIETLERKISDMNMKSRSAAIEIRNLPPDSSESSSSLLGYVSSIGVTVGMTVAHSELRDIYRIPTKTNTGPIIAEFTTVEKKQKIITAIRNYNSKKSREEKLNTSHIGRQGKPLPLYVSEQIPSGTRKLLGQAREFATKNGFKFCWVSNGNILLRKQEGDKPLLIRSEKCLSDITPPKKI